MTGGQLPALFAQHKTAIIGAAGAGVVGLALLQRKKAAASSAAGPSLAGTIPAAGVVPSTGVQAAYPDTGAVDTYNTIMDQLLKQQAAMNPPVPAAAPKPVASSLFAPTGSGKYVRYGSGTIAEVESDGSLYGIAPGEAWNYDGQVSAVQLPWYSAESPGYTGPAYGDLVSNLTTKKSS